MEYKTISARLPKKLSDKLEKMAKESRPRTSVTGLVEQAIEQFLFGVDDELIAKANAKVLNDAE